MRLIGFRGYDWEDDGYWCSIPNGHLPLVTLRPTIIPRAGAAPAFGSSYVSERTIRATFGHENGLNEDRLDTLLSRIRPLDPLPGQLRAERENGLVVAIEAVLTFDPSNIDSDGSVDVVPCGFVTTETQWKAVSEATTSKQFSGALVDSAVPVDVLGVGVVEPELRIKPTANRSTSSATAGVKYERVVTIANGSAQPFTRHPVRIDLGDTAALVTAGKARSDGADLAVWVNNREVPRALVAWNTAASYVWVIVDIPAGSTLAVSIVYGNPNRTAPLTFSQSTGPAFEASLSSNGQWRYSHNSTLLTESHGRGLWPQEVTPSSAAPPTDVYFDAPAAWRRSVTGGTTSRDDYTMPDYSAIGGGTRWNASLNVKRRRGGTGQYSPNRNADSVVLTHPLGITRVVSPITYTIPAESSRKATTPLARAILAYRGSGAAPWTVAQQFAAVATSPTNGTLDQTFPAAAREVAVGLWARANEIPSNANAASEASVVSQTGAVYTDVYLSTAGLTITTVTAERAVYEFALELRNAGRNGAGQAVGPYRGVRLGGANSRRLAVPLNYEVRLNGRTKRAEIYDNAGLKVGDVPANGVSWFRGVRSDTSTTELGPDATWLDLAPAANPFPNQGAESDASGFGAPVASNVTGAALSRLTASPIVGVGSFRLAGTSGAGAAEVYVQSSPFTRNGRDRVELAARLRPREAGTNPRLYVWFYDALGALVSGEFLANYGFTVGADALRILTAAWPGPSAESFRVGIGWQTTAGALARAIDADEIRVDGENVVVENLASLADAGTLTLGVRYLPEYA